MIISRRSLTGGSLAAVAAALLPRAASAQNGSLFVFAGDNGEQYYNYRLPAEPSVADLPGVVWTGAAHPAVLLVEYFDYNCPFCRKAEPDIDALLREKPDLRLGLVNDPILSAGSVQAAKVQQAVLRTGGPGKAYAFHRALFAKHGPVDGPMALDVAASLGLDRAAIETAADLPLVGEVIKRQAHLADALGFEATPAFQFGNIAMLGYPGPQAMARAVTSMRACDKLACG